MDLLKEIKSKSWSNKNAVAKGEWLFVTKIISALCKPFDQLATATQCAKNAYPGSKYYGMSVDDILLKWNTYSVKRAEEGVGIDAYTKAILSGNEISEDTATPEQKILFRNFDKLKSEILDMDFNINGNMERLQYLGSEIWVTSHTGYRGIMDSLFSLANSLVIFDWKTYENPSVHGWNPMVGPLSHLRDSDYNKATLQLYLYRYILEEEYKLPVSGVRIGQINSRDGKAIKPTFGYDVRLMNEIIDYAKKFYQ